MRPVKRGYVPRVKGKTKKVTDFKSWRADLINRLGDYCCYCNIHLAEGLQVEHITAQALASKRSLSWNNLLLSCGACNSRKNALLCKGTTRFLPHLHNTHLAFSYQIIPHPKQRNRQAAIVIVRPGLSTAQKVKAQATITLCGLDNVPIDKRRMDQAIDLRWKHRYNQCLEAGISRAKWNATSVAGQIELLDCIQKLAKYGGFFSVWFDAFHDVPIVKEALIRIFPGTADCFPTPSFNPVPRIVGDL